MSEDEKEFTNWTVVSGFGYRTQQPFVEVIIRPHEVQTQMPPAVARELAMNLLQAADAAESGAFLVTFLRKQVGADGRACAMLLNEFLEWRAAQTGEDD